MQEFLILAHSAQETRLTISSGLLSVQGCGMWDVDYASRRGMHIFPVAQFSRLIQSRRAQDQGLEI